MPNRGHARIAIHQSRCIRLMVELKDLGDRSDILIGLEQLRMSRPVNSHSRGKLPTVLNVKQESRNVS